MAKRGRPKKVFKYRGKEEPKFTPKRTHRFFYEEFEGGEIRWWDNNNFGDQFDIISKEELIIRKKAAEMLGITVIDHLPGFCDLMEKCPDHPGYY
jgi:hypothetical protein